MPFGPAIKDRSREFGTLARGADTIRQSIENAHGRTKDGEFEDCLEELSQAQEDCVTLAHQIMELRHAIGHERIE